MKNKVFITQSGSRSGKRLAIENAVKKIFDENPLARVMIMKANGQNELIEGTTFEDVTNNKLT